jgi:hypothetical protein
MSDSIPPIVENALQYADHRGWALLPMREKKFYTRDGVRIATHDPNIIKQWGWAQSFGLACGEPPRTDVLDIDDAQAFAAAGFDIDALAASTLAATTPSGGRHLFFEFAGLRSRVFPWGEWRSTGLAVVLPPAPRRRWLNDLTPQPAPPELIELIKQWRTVTFVGARTTRKAKEGNDAMNDTMIEAMSQFEVPRPTRDCNGRS